MHHYSLFRDEKYFSEPNTFAPERWIEEMRPAEWNHEERAFVPFSSGQYQCIGKALALQELRLFIAMVLRKVQFRFAEKHDQQLFLDSVQSNNTTMKGSLWLDVELRDT